MDISIATARPATQQANTVDSLVPVHLREGAQTFINFLEDYYSYLNTDGLPSQEINNIVTEQDIDKTSSQYLDLIQREIAKNVPRAVAFDRVSLYKKIVKYYLTKGSEDSIINFFKIFYDDAISIQYPRESLFKPSSGDYDESTNSYRDAKGFASNTNVLQDSYFWQDFSYVINSSISVLEWKNEFNNLVHPAGFKFFAILSLLITRRNNWIGRFVTFNSITRKYEANLPDTYRDLYKTRNRGDLDWLKGLTPPQKSNINERYSDNIGDHMPLFQYGLLSSVTIQNLILLANADDSTFTRITIIILQFLSSTGGDNLLITRNDYLKNLKFYDSDIISEYKESSIISGSAFDYEDIEFPIIDELHDNEDRDEILTRNVDTILLKYFGGNDIYETWKDRRKFSNISSFIETSDDSNLETSDGDELVSIQGDDLIAPVDDPSPWPTSTAEKLNLIRGAEAAYSLRNLTPVGTSVLTTGDSEIDTIGKYVVQLRRPTDNVVKSFTAAEVTDGTLQTWVNNYNVNLPLDQATGAAAAYSLRKLKAAGTDVTTSGDTAGDTTGKYVVQVRRSSDDAVKSFTASEVAGGILKAWVGTDNDGFVRTWYDQSGNTNHAVQTDPANQPTIVEGGVILDGINIDATNENLVLPNTSTLGISGSNARTVMAVMNSEGIDDGFMVLGGWNGNDSSDNHFKNYRLRAAASDGTARVEVTGYNTPSSVDISDGNKHLISSILTGTTTADLDISGDGTISVGSGTDTIDTGDFPLYVGFIPNRTQLGFGSIQELIIYNSDRSGDRRSIEESIASHYNIILDSFGYEYGFVKTWYDQSGNQNHARQIVDSKQPRIINNAITFDDTRETELVVDGNPVITADYSGTYSGFSVQNVSTEEGGYLYGNASIDDGTSLYAATVSANSTVPAYNLSDKRIANNIHDRIERSSGENLLSAVYDNQNAGLLVNGGGTMVDEDIYDFPAGTQNFVIGNRNGGSISAQYLTGSIKEIIVYNSNQSENRRAIEDNIIQHYEIITL